MSTHNKILVVESEKSPKVCSTNWKEDVILRRNMQVLDRSQKTVINRIVVDQKILNRRFQTKLSRSKMSYARATGNVEMKKRLRDKTTFVLNTNVGHKEEEGEVLQRIWERGKREYQKRFDTDIFRKKTAIGAFTCIEDDSPSETTTKKDPNVPNLPIKGLNLRPSTAVTIAKCQPIPQKRPFTSVEQRTRHSTDTHDHNGTIPSITIDPPQDSSDDDKRRSRPQTAFVTASSEMDSSRSHSTKASTRCRPSTAGGFLRTVLEPPSKTSTPRNNSARHNPGKPVSSNAGIGSMFDDDEFQISLLDFQRFTVHSANYEARVKNFAKTIKPLQVSKEQAIDYYNARMEAETKCTRTMKLEAARDATDEDIKRATGDLTIRSLTLNPVNAGLHSINTVY